MEASSACLSRKCPRYSAETSLSYTLDCDQLLIVVLFSCYFTTTLNLLLDTSISRHVPLPLTLLEFTSRVTYKRDLMRTLFFRVETRCIKFWTNLRRIAL